MLIDKLRADLKEAMKEKDEVRKFVVRTLITACNEEIRENKCDMTADEELAVVRKFVKQTNESISMFKDGGRTDLVEQYEAQLEVFNTYLPKQYTREEVETMVAHAIVELGLDTTNKGLMMKTLMPLFADQSDRGMINQVISGFVTK